MASLNSTLCQICEINSFSETNSVTNLDLRFFLRIILEIPKDYYLLSSIDPSYQLKTCYQCFSTIQQCRQIYSEMTKLTTKFREIQKTFIPTFCASKKQEITTSSSSLIDTWILQVKEATVAHDYRGFLHSFSVSREFDNLEVSSSSQPQNTVIEELIDSAIKIEPDVSTNENDDDSLDIPESEPEQPSQSDEELDDFLEKNLKEEPVISADDEEDSDDLEDDPLNSVQNTNIKSVHRPSSSSDKPSIKKPTRKKDPKKEPKPVRKYKSPKARKPSDFETRHPEYPKLVRNSQGKYFCPETTCTKQYSNRCDIELHVLSLHLNEAVYKCTFLNCAKILSSGKSLQMHLDRHNKTPRFKCTEDPKKCKKMFYSTIELNRHRQHAHANDVPCSICGKMFACQDYVNIHKINMHKDKPKFECSYCQRLFQLKSGLVRHLNLVHEQKKGKLGCQFCDYRFNFKIHLKSHLWRIHSFSMDGYVERKKVYREEARCPVKGCREAQTSLESLKNHMSKKHPGVKRNAGEDGLLVQDKETMPFKCKYCDKSYHHKFRLDIHHQSHENKKSKPFKCELCESRFATEFNLKRHLKRNHDVSSK